MFSKYKYVYAVYEEKNFTRAAQKLFISQPSLSAAVKKIEQKVGAPIFERGSADISLTQIGEEYISVAQKMLSLEKDFSNKIHDIYNLESGHISVGGTNYLSSYVLPKIVNSFREIYPRIEVSLVESNSAALHEMVKNEQVDIIVDSFEAPDSAHQAYPLISEKILLCVPAAFSVNKKIEKYRINPQELDLAQNVQPVPMDIFRNESFVLLKSGNDMYHRAVKIFEKSGINPPIAFSVDQLNISHALARSGIGICFLTDTFFKYGKFHENVLLYNLEKEFSHRTLYIVHKKNKYCTRAMSEFIKTAYAVIAQGL